jgi:hypothetical protein
MGAGRAHFAHFAHFFQSSTLRQKNHAAHFA